ncbi:MAG: tRNA (adenosine(37)-N6)-dimethylallyltransferase MiaA, partial [Planctomycetaceae bacterium]|nr:tRNA (adenosine(37)-N6)-dimethylallyltransferase MiaA [Planctomycetaceae bacterium]
AKPTAKEREIVPHHLFDILDPWEEFSVAEYHQAAERVIRDLTSRGKSPLFVGGTGLYLRSLLRGVFEGPPAVPALREEYRQIVATAGEAALHERLSKVDPVTAARLHPNDSRRVIRALEVFESTGKPISDQQQEPPLPEEDRPLHVYWLSPPRDWLYDRINRRVDQMLEEGLMDEVRRLTALPQGIGQTARQALGYKELFDYLEGKVPYETAVDAIRTRTRQFAKRQHTWYRNLVECREAPITSDDSVESILARILS